MRLDYFLILICFFSILYVNGQTLSSISGKIIDNYSGEDLQHVNVLIINSSIKTLSKSDGTFLITNLLNGDIILRISLRGFAIKNIPINIDERNDKIDIGIIRLRENIEVEIDQSFINLNDSDLNVNEMGESNSISGLLIASKDVFLKTVAYEFSPTFFKARNLGSEYTNVMLNGVVMNKLYNNRPQWSNWGGLNDVLRNQEYAINMSPTAYNFSSIAGATNILTYASGYRKGLKISYASSNRSYKGRIMATYSSGPLKNGWAYVFSASRRYANEGFKEGTLYDANSFFTSIEKRINKKHSLNLTFIYASNIRGKSSPVTQEVFELKNVRYNSYWGNQEDIIRNSRVKKIIEPIFQLSHFLNINSNTSIQSNITYQFGKVGNSRLDYGGSRLVINADGNKNSIGGGTNPDPTYYQKLPSYFLRDLDNPDYTNAYLAEQEFLKNGQLNWSDLYETNQNLNNDSDNSIYALYEDRNDDMQLSVKSILYKKLNNKFTLNAALEYKKLRSENFANMLDLLGGKGFLDVDVYADNIEEAQNDSQNLNRTVSENEKFKYNYFMDASILNGFVKTQLYSKKTDAYFALEYSNTNYQRTGLYENGSYPGSASLGKSKKLNFNNFSFKCGGLFKLTGRHLFTINAAYINKAPTLQNSFSNSRENNDIVIDLRDEKILSFDISYILRHPKIKAKVSGYWIRFKDQTDISFYFADGLTGVDFAETTAFVQEILTGIDKQNIGLEIGIEVPLITNIKLMGVAAIGQSVYSKNPNLYLTSDDFQEPINLGEVSLKNYFVSGGPQEAYSFGFEYSSPKYWWFGSKINYFKNSFINIAPITRTKNFYTDEDGLPINKFDEEIARELLRQERFEPYFLINMVGGKSWKIKNYYIGLFLNVSNILNINYKTGGFEQSRNANYNTLLEDHNRDKPLFGPKYWFGYGTSYYASVYFRF